MKETTAILLFSRSAKEEARFKKLATPNRRILEELILSTKRKAIRSGIPLVCSSEEIQKGKTFGQRLANEMQRVFSMGYEHIIVIGSDSPGLAVEHLIHASDALQRQHFVLGPSHDGGAFLIAMEKTAFHPAIFSRLSWETAHVYDDLRNYAGQLGLLLTELEQLSDIDSHQDLANWLDQAGIQPFALILKSILASDYQISESDERTNLSPVFSYKCLRAPPCIQFKY